MIGILIVDDHAIVRETLARLLRLEGYQTRCAPNGLEAMAAMEAIAADLILVDLMLPKKDGIALMEWLAADARWRHVPIIVLTGVIEGSQLERARELCGNDILFKARFDVDELFARIRKRLDSAHSPMPA